MLGLLWFIQRRVGRRQQQRRDGTDIVVRGRRSLGSKAQLVIVETDDTRYVLGVTEHGVNLIERMPAEHVTRPVMRPVAHLAPVAPVAREEDDSAEHRHPFDALLEAQASDAGDAADPDVDPAAPSLRRDRRTRRPDPLEGSILSPQTWRQTVDFVRRRR